MECSNCGHKFEVHTCATGEKAEMKNGDISICFNCGEVHQLKNGVLELIDIKCLPVDAQKMIKRAIIDRKGILCRKVCADIWDKYIKQVDKK